MKKMYAAFESLFSGGKAYEPTNQSQSSPVTITSFSQPDVLRKKMEEGKLSHGGTVTANLSPVRLDMDHGGVVMYFCPMKTMQVLNVVTQGDGGTIPAQAKIEGLSVPSHYKSGFYELKNVEVTSNGAILVKATEGTLWEQVESSFPE
ncbi:MAG TPA: hypothetical protein VL727_18475 [Puia sp.]|jgi:hypothetical protein|nr:hypothetical protein [Puia sp.]